MQILIIWSVRLKPKQEMQFICLRKMLYCYCFIYLFEKDKVREAGLAAL